MPGKIICVHLGARSHYLLPKALASQNKLEIMITDTWISQSWMRKLLLRFPLRLVKSFANRYNKDIDTNLVKHFSLAFLITEIKLRFKYKNEWDLILARNTAFETKALSIFLQLPPSAVFGTSYTALKTFEAAAARGQKKILFQIDAGIKDEKIVAAITQQNQERYPSSWSMAPAVYWNNWKKECALADVIMVNSAFSRDGLTEEGIDAAKIKIVDLPFQLNSGHTAFIKHYPAAFTKERPLRCLFLGALTLRKGIHVVLEAAQLLTDYPVEFVLVGQSEISEALLATTNVSYKGVATRAETDNFYKDADVFLFPTLSDGFGLTQLEAMAWKVPVIASLFCAPVVKSGYNGIALSNYNAAALVDTLKDIIHQPQQLASLSANCLATVQQYSVDRFATELAAL